MKVTLIKEFYFEAAHSVCNSGATEESLHGHSFKVEIVLEGEVVTEEGWLIDFGVIKKHFLPLLEQLDHSHLNDIEGMDSTSPDGIAKWIRERMAPHLSCLKDIIVSVGGDNMFRPTVLPPDSTLGLPPRIRFTFEAAQSLPQLPDSHPCKRLHGHSYRVEVGAKDLNRIEEYLMYLYDELDHKSLNDIEGLNMATCEVLCEWIWKKLEKEVDDLTVVVVQETDSARCIYYGE